MLPGAYVFLDALPQAATGKIDRMALPVQTPLPEANSVAYEPPADELEAKIAAAFEKVLGYAPVGRKDDFFLKGGDSLSLVELNMEMVNLFGNNVPTVFDEATVAGVAQAMRSLAAKASQDARLMPVILPLRKGGTWPILFLVHGRRGQAHVSKRFLELIGDDQPLYAFQARGVDGIQQPHKTIQAMAEDYVAAMRSVQPRGPYFVSGLCSGSYIAVKIAQILRLSGERVSPLVLVDPPVPPFTADEAAKNVQSLEPGLRSLAQKGNIEFDFNDPYRRKGAVNVVVSLENALVQDPAVPYDGPVYLLASREKLSQSGWGNQQTLKSRFRGPLQIIEIGIRHTQILEVGNQQFAGHLAQCIRSARQAITDGAAASKA